MFMFVSLWVIYIGQFLIFGKKIKIKLNNKMRIKKYFPLNNSKIIKIIKIIKIKIKIIQK